METVEDYQRRIKALESINPEAYLFKILLPNLPNLSFNTEKSPKIVLNNDNLVMCESNACYVYTKEDLNFLNINMVENNDINLNFISGEIEQIKTAATA